MNQNMLSKKTIEKIWIIAAMGMAVFALFLELWPIGFAVHDDLRTYLEVKCGTMWESTGVLARVQGRFYFYFSAIFTFFPYLFGSLKVVKLISYACLLFDAFAFYLLLKRISGKQMGLLGFMLFFSLGQLQSSFQHNLFVAYIGCHQIAIGILLLALESYLAFMDTKSKRHLFVSAVLLLFCTMLYEAFVLFSISFFLLSCYHHAKEKGAKKIFNIFWDLRLHILLEALFLAAYFIWQHFYPSQYSGAMVGSTSVLDSLRAIFVYATGYFPLRTAYRIWRWLGIRNTFSIGKLLVSILIGSAGVLIIKKSESKKRVGLLAILGITGVFLPVLMHGLTSKYIDWLDQGIYSYVPSFYSYFFILMVIVTIVFFLYQLLSTNRLLKWIYLVLVFLAITGSSYVTQIGNEALVPDYVTNLKRYEAFDEAVSSEEFAQIPEGAVVFAPDYIGVHYSLQSLSDYGRSYSGKEVQFINNEEELPQVLEQKGLSSYYIFSYDEEKGSINIEETDLTAK